MKNSLSKSERISKKDEIDLFFKGSKQFTIPPFRVLHYLNPQAQPTSNEPLRVLVSIPKKLIKKAVHRNLLKRRTKEAFRTNKNPLKLKLIEQETKVSVMLIYNTSETHKFDLIEDKIILILQRLQGIYAKSTE